MNGLPIPYGQPALPYTAPPAYTSDTASTAAPPSYTASPGSIPSLRLFHVYTGYPATSIQILGLDKTTVLYRVHLGSGSFIPSKPYVAVYNGGTGTIIGTVTFHNFSRTREMIIHNNPVALHASGFFTRAHEWTSLAATADGRPMQLKWKYERRWNGGMICLDQQNRLWARYEFCKWAWKKLGKFAIGPSVNGILMDEIIVTGMVMLELRRKAQESSG